MTCARCQKVFDCKSDNIQTCNCAKVHLSADTLKYLSNTNYSCLCNRCLLELDAKVNMLSKEKQFSNSDLQEGRDYYMESGNFVFNELYHIRRGYCCKSGCRHCAYGYHLDKK